MIVLVWAVELILDIEILVFIVGWKFVLNKLLDRNIWLLVMEIMLVGM